MRLIIASLLIWSAAATGCDTDGHQDFGAGIPDPENLTAIANIVGKPTAFEGKTVTVKGIIATVCPHSGCFLRLGDGPVQLFIDLEGSGFTLPPGQNVGKVALATGAVKTVGAEAQLVATGVRILE